MHETTQKHLTLSYDDEPQTNYPIFSHGFNFKQKEKTSNENYEPTLLDYKNILNNSSNNESAQLNLVQKFEDTKVDCENLKFKDYIQYLSENGKITADRKLFAHLQKTLDAMQFDGLITQRTQNIYKKQVEDSYYLKNKLLADNNKQNFYQKIDYSSYYATTTKKVNDCELINKIFDNGGEIYLDKKTKICLRLSEHAELLTLTRKEAENVLFSEFGFKVKITNDVIHYTDFVKGMNDEIKKAYPISIHQLKRIDGQQYRPDIPYKYFEENKIWYENTHVPSELMMLTGEPTKEPNTILDLIFHLTNNDIDKFEYLLNWISKSYTYGKKTETAIILFGDEGSGKGTLNTIMTQLYGEHNCSQLNKASFKDKHNIVNEITNKRFMNIDEVSMKLSEQHEELFKGIIGNPSITLRGKIDIHFQCILTANYSTVFKIPEKGRRFTVIKTANSLESTNFLGFGSYDAFIMQVHKELEDFSKYIKSYDVDFKLADNPLDTEEKTEIINKSKNYLKDFHKAIIELNIDSFSIMAREDDHYKEIFKDMKHDFIRYRRVNRSHLKVAWEALYGDELSTIAIMNMLKDQHEKAGFRDYIFDSDKIQPKGSKHYIYPEGY